MSAMNLVIILLAVIAAVLWGMAMKLDQAVSHLKNISRNVHRNENGGGE